MDIVTLGMLIIDEIHYKPPRKPEVDVLGGAGSWAVCGARLFRPAASSKRIGWTVHRGSDFPVNVQREIDSWETTCNLVDTPHRLTTRGWNNYGEDEERAFKYLTEKLRVDETQLTDSLLLSRTFHLICTPSRCISLVEGIKERRGKLATDHSAAALPPIFVWEPVPDAMGPEVLESLLKALKYVDVVSPNHQELAAVFSEAGKHGRELQDMDAQCSELLDMGFGDHDGAIVVRCGKHGCYIATAKSRFQIPAYHLIAEKVIDPTGAGNAFLGGFCVGMLDKPEYRDVAIENGAIYGSVAASFAVEQVGLPKLTGIVDGIEQWNNAYVKERLQDFKRRLAGSTSSVDK